MLQFFQNFSRSLLGKKLNPLNAETRHAVALAAFLAWVGLGADGLSSSAYGPEEAFKALGEHTFLGFYLAIATALTVIIISISYNQIIELFPNGGGGYRIASQLIHPVAGLTSGAALLVDYVLTIAISVASGIDALFSLLDPQWQFLKLPIEEVMMVLLLWINLRGAKESIKILLPIFMSFVVLHIALIVYGVGVKSSEIPQLVSNTWQQTTTMASNSEIGWLGIFFLFMKAYSMGGGTYTGIEAVSNNVQSLAEPRVANGKRTTWYMAISLAFTSGGIILLYLLWHTHHQAGQTLNAIMSQQVLAHLGFSSEVSLGILTAILLSEAGLLMVAANTGFLGGPAVLANMAQDSWVPHQFRYLSSRLVTQNGVIVMGLSAMLILWASSGSVAWLVVLYLSLIHI
jgi:amino acid transporter